MKTVFVLGAGFSYGTGAPMQSQIIKEIIRLHGERPWLFDAIKLNAFEEFLTETLSIPPDKVDLVPLEDVFTPLDRCLLDGISFRSLDLNKVKEMRELIQYLIGVMMQELLLDAKKEHVDQFANVLVQACSVRRNMEYKKNRDPASVVSLNWDILLDNSINSKIQEHEHKYGRAVVDYCCHISSYDQYNENVKPGLEVLGMGGYNVKLLKLHGSLNWLQCPRCMRLYVDYDNKIAVQQYLLKNPCRHCNKNFVGEQPSVLEANLIMPTFLKNLSNPQFKLIWQNAGIELAEADKVVFIGYSLPQADFEVRQLLSRMIRKTATIEVITKGKESDHAVIELMGRYKVFFGNRKITPFYEGAASYIQNHLNLS